MPTERASNADPKRRSDCRPDAGVYIAVFLLPEQMSLCVGRRGTQEFQPGYYFYVGSAQRALSARLARHGRRDKPLRWHIDALSTRAVMLGAIVVTGAPKSAECELAARLAERLPRPVPHFGDSDCRCGGHLFYTEQL